MEPQLKNDHAKILRYIEEDTEKITSFFSQLVQCKTPSTVGDTREAVSLIETFLLAEGVDYEILSHCKTMPNIILSLSGTKKGRHLMLSGHLDVMPAGSEPGWKDTPWSGAIYDGRVWGRGTSDMKAGVTAMLFAYKYLHRMSKKLSGRLSLSLVADEETGWGRGTGFLLDTIPDRMIADCILTGEPSGMDAISFASKGFMGLSLKVRTRGAIAGYSHMSKNAIEIAADVIRDLKNLEAIEVKLPQELESFFSNNEWLALHRIARGENEAEQLRKITVDVCTIKGGSLSSVIPSECTLKVSIIFPQGTDVPFLTEKVKKIVDKYPEVSMKIEGTDFPDMSDPDGELPKIIQSMAGKVGRKKPILTPDIAMSDCRYWRYQGIPAYWYGPGGDDCSAANESVLIDDLLDTVRIHTLTAFEYLQQ